MSYALYILFPAILMAQISCKAQAIGAPDKVRQAFISCEGCQALYVDALDHIYVVDDRQEIRKYTPSGELSNTYSNRLYGDVHSVDVTNPLKILVFYMNYQKIIILDNTLTEVSQIDLEEWGLVDITAIGTSADNRIWLFDNIEYKLVKYDENGNRITESDPFTLHGLSSYTASRIVERNYQVIMNDEDNGLVLCDNFGQFVRNLGIRPGRDFDVFHDGIYYLNRKVLEVYRHDLQDVERIPLPDLPADTKKALLMKGHYLFLDAHGVQKVVRSSR